jgi:elongation factor P hydroxylase
MHNAFDLVQLFERCFFAEFNTRLEGGADEPLYLPATVGHPARILFTRDYFASALHEVAHWCIAGEARRQMSDYGYWYAADGRSAVEQREFEKVEVKPQALEWIFGTACGTRFRVSADNLASGLGASDEFKEAIAAQARAYCACLPSRPARFAAALKDFYGADEVLDPALYRAECLV